MPKKIKDGKFMDKLLARQKKAISEGKKPPCECWTCLREDGLTPPLRLRGRFRCQFPKPWHSHNGPGVDIPGRDDCERLVKGEKERQESTPAEDKLEAVRV